MSSKWKLESDNCDCWNGDIVAIVHAMGGLEKIFDMLCGDEVQLEKSQMKRIRDLLRMQKCPPTFRRRTQLLKLEHIVPGVKEMFQPLLKWGRSTTSRFSSAGNSNNASDKRDSSLDNDDPQRSPLATDPVLDEEQQSGDDEKQGLQEDKEPGPSNGSAAAGSTEETSNDAGPPERVESKSVVDPESKGETDLDEKSLQPVLVFCFNRGIFCFDCYLHHRS